MAQVRRILELFEHGVAIPRTAGIIYDAISLVIGIIGSLFPAWNPHQPPPRIAVPPANNAPPAAAAAAPDAVAANGNNEGNNG